jgi:hypothetical protein
MYNYQHCDDKQKKILDRTPYFFLTKEEQVNFHFMMHMRLNLKSPDFMASFERKLLKSKYQQLRDNCADFDEGDYKNTFIPLKTYDFKTMDRTEFQTMINDENSTPIVAKGFLNDTLAVKEWTHEYLMENHKEVEIVAFNYNQDSTDFKKLRLAEILGYQLDEESRESYYINNSAEIFNDYPEMIDDMGADKVLDLFEGHSVNSFSQIFVGNLKTWGTNWHLGNDISCALMINGMKRWYFMDPRLAYILKPALNGPNGMITHVDVRHDLNFHKIHDPLYAYAPKLYVDIEPGDVIFFTKYWPHAVLNLSALQIMANMRMTEADLESMQKGFEAASLLPVYDNILNSDLDFIKFKFDIFQSLGKKSKDIGDNNYFSAFSTTDKVLKEKI